MSEGELASYYGSQNNLFHWEDGTHYLFHQLRMILVCLCDVCVCWLVRVCVSVMCVCVCFGLLECVSL